jgi:hypothetical protein
MIIYHTQGEKGGKKEEEERNVKRTKMNVKGIYIENL